MPPLKDIRRRLRAVRNTQKVTRAMKLVAAARLKKAQQAVADSRAYSSGIYTMAMRVSRRLGVSAPLMWRGPEEINCIDLIVVTSDRGLCGSFNERLLGAVDDGIETAMSHSIHVKLYAIGRKGIKYLSAKGYDLEVPPSDIGDNVHSWITGRVVDRYRKRESAGTNIVFNKFESASRQEPTFWNFLPLHKRGKERERHMEYLYEPGRETALDLLCNEVLISTLSLALLESKASELAARMIAMDSATKNAEEMIAHLTSVYNKARQEAITKELIDIIGGAEALK